MKNQAGLIKTSLVLIMTGIQVISASGGTCQPGDTLENNPPQNHPSVSCLGANFGFGNHGSFGLSYDLLGRLGKSKNADIGVRLAYRGFLFPARNLPDNYIQGLSFKPRDGITMLTAMLAVEVPGKETDFGFMIGPAFNLINEITFTLKESWMKIGSNYSREYNQINELGLMLEIKVKITDNYRFGMETSGYININMYRPMVGLSLGIVFGNL